MKGTSEMAGDDEVEERAVHTPGPWAYRPRRHDDWGFVRSADGNLVACAKDSSVPFDAYDTYRARNADPYEANARLIAAAPELLNELKAVQQQCLFADDYGGIGVSENVTIPSDMFDRICAAISKAEGRS